MTISLDREQGVDASSITVTKLTHNIGALVEGVKLSGDLPAETVAAIRAAILEHKVVFFHDQFLDDDAQIAFGERLGPLTTAHPTVNTGSARVLSLKATRGMAANSWHTDVTFVDRPPAFSILRGETVPAYGGHTAWANGATAYDALPDQLKALVDGLWALHTNEFDYAQYTSQIKQAGEAPGLQDTPDGSSNIFKRSDFQSSLYKTEHPVVRVHPETGERVLQLGHFIKSFIGFNDKESQILFNLLQDRMTKLENTIRWAWTPGDIAIWDNRATQHYGVADFGLNLREVRRITVQGDEMVAIDGQRSRLVQGSSDVYNHLDELIR
ncbi:MAG: TauD/TfdA family dioxygenase [Nocardioides sp.]|uniref:TauD/TfdA dioxygenase family protein n=1 Tax=Nocardioides sp. TaxID=35761 RepID=UPI0039E643B9